MAELQQVSGKRVVIFRGDRGRELLGDSLLKRGAVLAYVECYRRVKPSTDLAPLLKAWAAGKMDAITISSSEGLRNIFDMVAETDVSNKESRNFATEATEAGRRVETKLNLLEAKLAESQSQQLALEALYQELTRNSDEVTL